MSLPKYWFALIIVAPLLLSGCSSLTQDETLEWSADKLYEEAKLAMEDANYERALELYGKLEARFPYGIYAQQAQLETIYLYYKDSEPLQSIAAADRFIKLHPRHKNVDYAYYMRGLASFEPRQSFLGQFNDKRELERDPQWARDAFNYFKQLVERYPNSKYTPDAVQRMIHLRNNLAAYELMVARFNQDRGIYLAAVNRAQYVVENYDKTPAVPEALALMVEVYRILEMPELADDALSVLRLNFPEHEALARVSQNTTTNTN